MDHGALGSVADPSADVPASTEAGELTGQARRGHERRQAIVDAALTVFAERGSRGSLADVSERVGVSPAGILYHFGTKEGLLLAVVAERDRRAAQRPADPSLTGLAALRSVLEATALQCEGERGLAALHTVLGAESLDPEAVTHDYFLLRSRVLRASVAERLRAAQVAGEVRPEVDVVAKAMEVVAFLEGAAVVWLTDPEVSLVALSSGYFDDLARFLAPEGGR